MKKYFLLFIIFSILNSASGQSKIKPENAASPKISQSVKDPEIEIYNRAVQYGDAEAAKYALYSLMIKHPNDKGWLDSLVVLYYNLNAFPQCVLAGYSYLEKDTSNKEVMEMVAQSNSALKRNKEAVELYEKLFYRTGKIYYAYQLAVQQYLLKRIGECNQMIDIIVGDPSSVKETIPFGTDNGSQQVPMIAAALNLRGIILSEINMKDKSKETFESALKIFPDFALAKKNLESLKDQKENTEKNSIKEQPVKSK